MKVIFVAVAFVFAFTSKWRAPFSRNIAQSFGKWVQTGIADVASRTLALFLNYQLKSLNSCTLSFTHTHTFTHWLFQSISKLVKFLFINECHLWFVEGLSGDALPFISTDFHNVLTATSSSFSLVVFFS